MYLSPVFQENQFTDNVEFLVGGLLWTYKAGTSEFALTYQDQAGTTPWPNPIILNSRGETGGELWLSSDNEYRLVVETAPEYGQTHGVVITEFDNVSGVNAPATEASDNWVVLNKTPNYIDANEFSVEGDYRGIFVTNRKIQITDTSGTSVQSVIGSSLVSGFTRIEVSATIDAGISSVKYSNVAPDASPNRFVDIYASGDLSVTDTIVAGGNVVIAGSATVPTINGGVPWTDANCPNSNAANGYQKFESGVIMQWGIAAISASPTVVTFPTPFTTTNYSVTATGDNTNAQIAIVDSGANSVSQITIELFNTSGTNIVGYVNWLAIGY